MKESTFHMLTADQWTEWNLLHWDQELDGETNLKHKFAHKDISKEFTELLGSKIM